MILPVESEFCGSVVLIRLSPQLQASRDVIFRKMSFPNLLEAPDVFADYLTSSNLHIAHTTFSHCRNRPVKTINGWYDEGLAMQWCDHMDSLLVCTHTSHHQYSHLLIRHSLLLEQISTCHAFAT